MSKRNYTITDGRLEELLEWAQDGRGGSNETLGLFCDLWEALSELKECRGSYEREALTPWTVTECEQAKMIAERWLGFQMNPLVEMVQGDPDCDACVLARQYIRALERLSLIDSLCMEVTTSKDTSEP